MKILIVAATYGEVQPFLTKHNNNQEIPHADFLPLVHTTKDAPHITVLVTGVGQVATTYHLQRELMRNKYDFVLQVGVCGSFDDALPLGEVVHITSERWGDLGAEDHDNYIDIFDMGLLHAGEGVYNEQCELETLHYHTCNNYIKLRKVKGLTVNTVSGNANTIERRKKMFACDVESMEGGALHFTCLNMEVPFAQVRAISNYVIPRDKSQWQMKEAIINLNKWLIDFVAQCKQ